MKNYLVKRKFGYVGRSKFLSFNNPVVEDLVSESNKNAMVFKSKINNFKNNYGGIY